MCVTHTVCLLLRSCSVWPALWSLHRSASSWGIPVLFHVGLFHKQWFAEQQPYVQQVEMVQPSQPHLAVVESTIHCPMPKTTSDVPAVDMPATIDVNTMAGSMEANAGPLFNNLMAIAKQIMPLRRVRRSVSK